MARLPLSTMADWNYVGGGSVGHAEVLDGTWKSPEAQPPSARGAVIQTTDGRGTSARA